MWCGGKCRRCKVRRQDQPRRSTCTTWWRTIRSVSLSQLRLSWSCTGSRAVTATPPEKSPRVACDIDVHEFSVLQMSRDLAEQPSNWLRPRRNRWRWWWCRQVDRSFRSSPQLSSDIKGWLVWPTLTREKLLTSSDQRPFRSWPLDNSSDIRLGGRRSQACVRLYLAMASECSVRVVCRYRPQNSIEEQSGGKVVAKFPSRDSVNHNVRLCDLANLAWIWCGERR